MIKNKALTNGLWNVSSRVILGAAQILGSVMIVRGLNQTDPSAYGIFSYYATVAGLIMTLGVLALPNALTKLSSELRGEGKEQEALALSRWLALLLLAFNLLISMVVVAWALTSEPPVRWYLLVVALSPIFHVLLRVMSSNLWGFENYRPVSMASSLGGIAQVALIALAYFQGWGITGYLMAVVLSTNVFIPLFLAVRLVPMLRSARLAKPSHEPIVEESKLQRASITRFFHFATPATLVLIFDTIIWQRSEVIILERLSTVEQIGFYSLGFSIFMICVGLGFALINGYFPAISREFGSGNWNAIRAKLREACFLSAFFAVPLTLGSWAIMSYVLPLVYGEVMRPAVMVTNILMTSLAFSVTAGVFGLAIKAVNKVWLTLPLSISFAIINVVLDVLLIPSMGAVGGAMANTVAQLGNAIAHFILVYRLTKFQFPLLKVSLLLGVSVFSAYLVPVSITQLLPDWRGIGLALACAGMTHIVGLWLAGLLASFGYPGPIAKRFKPIL